MCLLYRRSCARSRLVVDACVHECDTLPPGWPQLHRVLLVFDDPKFETEYRVTALGRMSLGFRRMLIIMFLYFLYRLLDYTLRRYPREQDDTEVPSAARVPVLF